MTQEELFKKLVAHCKEYGFVFPSSEIYDGLGAVYDYGQNGVELKNNIKRYWWDSMVKLHENIVGIDAAIFMHPRTWEASGHVSAFNDPLIDNKDSKKRYRADVLIEEWIAKQDEKIEKEVEKARKRFGESFDEEKYRATSPRVAETAARRDEVHARFAEAMNANDLGGLRQIILDCEIACPISGTRNWTEVRQFNLMFKTFQGVTEDAKNTVYLRPETAQGIFVNFKNVQRTSRKKIPFGIGQVGKSFRNEITPGNFTFRTREFEQMELEFFCEPGTDLEWFKYWRGFCRDWLISLGIKEDEMRLRDHDPAELAFYSKGTTDIEFLFPFGWGELWGIADRTDYDLGRHQEVSGQDLTYFDDQKNEKYLPYVIEPSLGADRVVLAFLCAAYDEEDIGTPEKPDVRTVFHFHPALAPVKIGVLPLSKKLNESAEKVFAQLSKTYNCEYDDRGTIGKRYRRQDEIGTPFCVTYDFDSEEDHCVTVRDRDTMEQERIAIDELDAYFAKKFEF